jgi:hypothetical protein
VARDATPIESFVRSAATGDEVASPSRLDRHVRCRWDTLARRSIYLT